jgi:hypothetical protein
MSRIATGACVAEPIDNRLIDEVLKDVQTRLARLEGCATRCATASRPRGRTWRPSEAVFLERGVLELERDMERGKRRSQVADPADPS